MNFVCAECGCNRLEEVMTDVVLTSVITSIGEGGDIEYGPTSTDDGEVSQYQCLSCGTALSNEFGTIRNSEDLFTFLNEKGMA